MRLPRLVVALALCVAPATAAAQRPLTSAEQDSVRDWLSALGPELRTHRVDPAAAVHGERVVPAAEPVSGDVLSFRGNLDVHGDVAGNAVAIGGDVILRPTAHVRGDVLAIGGTVRQEGGRADGEIRSLTGHAPGIEALFAERPSTVRSPRQMLSLTAGWFAVLAAIAFAVLLLARANLVTIAERIRTDFGKALLMGLAGQLAVAPLLVLLVVGLAITLIGILLIPFVLVAYALVLAGAVTLGFLAMAYANGRSLRRRQGGDETVGDITTHLMIGLVAYFALWAVAALAGQLGIVGSLLRAMVVVITWVAVTIGLGAVILSRAGTRSPSPLVAPEPEEDEYSWQTPTPVSGVAAARRPTPAPRAAQRK